MTSLRKKKKNHSPELPTPVVGYYSKRTLTKFLTALFTCTTINFSKTHIPGTHIISLPKFSSGSPKGKAGRTKRCGKIQKTI